jgi:hypothetical protein
MAEIKSFRRVLIVADETADWMVAGLRQLDRLALAIDEFAIDNKEAAPVLVCIFWRPNLDQFQRWLPRKTLLARINLRSQLEGSEYDLVLSTRLFLYRHAIRQLMAESVMPPPEATSSSEPVELWKNYHQRVESLPRRRDQSWEYIVSGDEIDEIEKRFLRGSGKPQDGLVSRYLNRPISRAVTRLLLRFPTTPNGWTFGIFPIVALGTLILCQGTYAAFVWGMVLFHIFSILDGCDGEIARAKYLESEPGRELDDFFDILSNILLVIGLGSGLFAQAKIAGHFGWPYLVEGVLAGILIAVNELKLANTDPGKNIKPPGELAATLYPRHREMVEGSGILFLGEKFTYWLFQFTKRDVAVLFFVLLAVIGWPALILHLQFAVTAISFVLALRSRSTERVKT